MPIDIQKPPDTGLSDLLVAAAEPARHHLEAGQHVVALIAEQHADAARPAITNSRITASHSHTLTLSRPVK